jgi:hypothetical protein
MRRLITGLIKVVGIARRSVPVDAISNCRISVERGRRMVRCAFLPCNSISSFPVMAIWRSVSGEAGLRYPETSIVPTSPDSMREFWRRWHVTSITWLRDYLAFPMAGRDADTALFPSIVTGFALLGFWYGGGWTVHSGQHIRAPFSHREAVGFGARISFWPTPVGMCLFR